MRRVWVLLAVAALVSGVAAYLYYFAWPEPLLDTSRIASYSYGAQGVNPLEYKKVTRADDPGYVRHADGARARRPVGPPAGEARSGAADGHPPPGRRAAVPPLPRRTSATTGTWQVGISEGDESYLGTLDQPQLVELLRTFEERLTESEEQR